METKNCTAKMTKYSLIFQVRVLRRMLHANMCASKVLSGLGTTLHRRMLRVRKMLKSDHLETG